MVSGGPNVGGHLRQRICSGTAGKQELLFPWPQHERTHVALYDECPAIQELKKALLPLIPIGKLETITRPSQGTRHTSGIAMDIMLNMRVAEEYELANAIIAAVTDVEIYKLMRWSDLIYSAWTDVPGGEINHYHISGAEYHGYAGTPLKPSDYTKDKNHEDHIHIDWVDFSRKNPEPEYTRNPYQWTESAKATGFASTLQSAVERFRGKAIAPTLSLDWLWGWWTVNFDGELEFYFFRPDGTVEWTDTKPATTASPIHGMRNRGTYLVRGMEIVMTWNEVAGARTVETFRVAAGKRTMSGSSSRGSSMSAKKM